MKGFENFDNPINLMEGFKNKIHGYSLPFELNSIDDSKRLFFLLPQSKAVESIIYKQLFFGKDLIEKYNFDVLFIQLENGKEFNLYFDIEKRELSFEEKPKYLIYRDLLNNNEAVKEIMKILKIYEGILVENGFKNFKIGVAPLLKLVNQKNTSIFNI